MFPDAFPSVVRAFVSSKVLVHTAAVVEAISNVLV